MTPVTRLLGTLKGSSGISLIYHASRLVDGATGSNGFGASGSVSQKNACAAGSHNARGEEKGSTGRHIE